MRRRGLILAASLLVAPASPARAAGRLRRVGALHASPWSAPHHVAFRAALARYGLVEGSTISLDPEGHGLSPDAFAPHAEVLAQSGVDAIHVTGDAAVGAARSATRRIPILALADDLVLRGFAASFAQPGGNVTGISILASDLDGKRQDMLLEAMPAAQRIGAILDPAHTPPARAAALRAAADRRGVALDLRPVAAPDDIGPALAGLAAAGAEAVNVLASPLLFANRRALYAGLAAHRLPGIYQWPDMAREGGLMAYGPNLLHLYRDRIPAMLTRLLNGVPAALMPIEIPTRFELVLNAGVARGLGIAMPAALLARADEVIE